MHITSTQKAISSWLKNILDNWRDPTTGDKVTMTRLSEIAGVSTSTLSRNLNPKPDYTYEMSTATIRKIVQKTGMAPPIALGVDTGFAEPDVAMIEDAPETFAGETVDVDQSVWVINTRTLELHGLLPGDQVLLDQSVEPVSGDVVFAQVYSIERGSAETVIRLYERGKSGGSPAFLHTKTADPSIEPRTYMVDGERVMVIGTVLRTLRTRRTDA